MTTSIIFKIDKKLKEAAQKCAKAQGVTLTDFYKSATRDFVKGKITVGLEYPMLTPNAKTMRLLRQDHKEYLAGKNMSPILKTNKEVNDYLDSL